MTKRTHDTPFVVRDDTPIPFGKLKTKPHTILLNEEHSSYVSWLLRTEPEFATATKVWLASHGFVV